MIYITCDTHGDVTRFSMDNFPEQKTFTDQNENYVIICGDFGLVWNYLAETPSEKYWLKWLEIKSLQLFLLMVITIVILDWQTIL